MPMSTHAHSTNPPIIDQVLDHVAAGFLSLPLSQQQAPVQVLVALSGGMDSCVLFDILCQLQTRLPIQVSAMHVHHGLSPHADAWLAFCQQLCQDKAIPFQFHHLSLPSQPVLGVEAEARRQRYLALAQTQAELIALAHHQDDQAETLLLQGMRGAGVKGMAAMPIWDAQYKRWRPLLDLSRQSLLLYAQQRRLSWIEDESNQSLHFQRNRVRHELIPFMQQCQPAVIANLARSASLLAEAQQLIDSVASEDAQRACQQGDLNLHVLRQLPAPRASHLLRYWFAQQQLLMPSQARLMEIMRQLCEAEQSQQPTFQLRHRDHQHNVTLYRHQGWAKLQISPLSVGQDGVEMQWRNATSQTLADGSQLLFAHQRGQGLSLQKIDQQAIHLQYRHGGERIKLFTHRPSKTLKQWWQTFQVPAWQRQQIPLLYIAQELVALPNIGVQCGWQATSDEMGLVVQWQPAQG